MIAGWGTIDKNVYEMSNYLLEGLVMILNTQDCPQRSNLHSAYNFNSMMCAFNKGVDTCQVRNLLELKASNHQIIIHFIRVIQEDLYLLKHFQTNTK